MAEGRRLPERLEPIALLPRAQAAVFVRKFAIAPNAKNEKINTSSPKVLPKGSVASAVRLGPLQFKRSGSSNSLPSKSQFLIK